MAEACLSQLAMNLIRAKRSLRVELDMKDKTVDRMLDEIQPTRFDLHVLKSGMGRLKHCGEL